MSPFINGLAQQVSNTFDGTFTNNGTVINLITDSPFPDYPIVRIAFNFIYNYNGDHSSLVGLEQDNFPHNLENDYSVTTESLSENDPSFYTWYSIYISKTNYVSSIFKGYFKVDNRDNKIKEFYQGTNNILVNEGTKNISGNTVNTNTFEYFSFSGGGTLITPTILDESNIQIGIYGNASYDDAGNLSYDGAIMTFFNTTSGDIDALSIGYKFFVDPKSTDPIIVINGMNSTNYENPITVAALANNIIKNRSATLIINIIDFNFDNTTGIAYGIDTGFSGTVIRFQVTATDDHNNSITDFLGDPLVFTLDLPHANPYATIKLYKLNNMQIMDPQPLGYPAILTHKSGTLWEASLQSISDFVGTDNNPICFNEGTKILCLNKKFEEEYIPIENLRKGDLVKSYKHGYRKIDLIGKNPMINNPEKFYECMYKMEKTNENGLIEDLIVTGGHSILVDDLGENKEENEKIFKGTQMIDDKYLLLSCVSKDFKKLENNNLYNYYHFVLENSGNDERYGVWANGILTETPSKNFFMSQKLNLLV